MTRRGECRFLQRRMTRRKRPRRTFAMHPAFACEAAATVRQQFLPGYVVADEIHQRPFHTRNDFLKRLQHQRVDEQMIHRREVRA